MQIATTDNFDNLTKDGPVLVDFWAPWCGPCITMEPILEGYDGMPVIKLNVDDYPDVASKFGISSIPTMKVFIGGEAIHTIVGSRPLPALVDELANFVQVA